MLLHEYRPQKKGEKLRRATSKTSYLYLVVSTVKANQEAHVLKLRQLYGPYRLLQQPLSNDLFDFQILTNLSLSSLLGVWFLNFSLPFVLQFLFTLIAMLFHLKLLNFNLLIHCVNSVIIIFIFWHLPITILKIFGKISLLFNIKIIIFL